MEENNIELVFYFDGDKNWISRLPSGKIVILHRSNTVTPEPNIKYLCKVQEKEKTIDDKTVGYAFAWIVGVAEYPRAIIGADKRCIIVKSPAEEPKIYDNIYNALLNYPNEYWFTIYRKENRTALEELDDSLLRTIEVEIKLKESEGNSLKTSFKLKRLRSMDLKEILDTIRKKIEE